MNLAMVKKTRLKAKRGQVRQYLYTVWQGGKPMSSYSTAVYPTLGVGGAKDKAQKHARRLNGGI